MKTKKCAQYSEKKKRTEGHKLQSPKRDTYSLPGKSAPFTTQRADSGSLLVQPHHHTLSQPSSHTRVTGLGQQSSRELRGQRHRHKGPWRFGQGFSGRDSCELPGVGPGYQNSFEGSLVQGLDQCHRNKSFRQGVQVRGRRRFFKRRWRKARKRSQTQTVKSQSSGFRRSGPQSVRSRECKCPHFYSPQSECQGRWSGSISTHDCTTSCLSSLGCPSTDELISEAVKNLLKLDATLSVEDTLKETTNVAESLKVCSCSQHPTCETTTKERVKASRWDVTSTETALRLPDDGKPKFETTIKEKGKASRWDVTPAETTLRLPDDGKPTFETTIKERVKASRWDVPSAETLKLPDDGKPTFETTIKERGKASRWDVASTETTLRLPDDGKEQTDSEKVEAYEQQRRRLLILSGTISSTDPSVGACQSLHTPSGDASAVLTPLQVQESACITTDKQIKKVSAGISKFRKEKPTALGSPYTIHEQKQVSTGKVTELFLETDDDLDIKLDIQPPASLKAQRRRFQMQQFPKKSPKNESCKLPDHLKTQQVRSLHALALDIVSNNDLYSHAVNTVTGPQTENQIIAPQKEFSFGASNELEESDHSPWRKGPLCTPDSSPLKGKTPETTTGPEAIRSVTIGDHRRIVKIKPKHPRSSSTTDRRLIKVKSHQTSFKDILSSESHESGSNPTCKVKNHTDEEHVEGACAGSERETAASEHDADQVWSEDTQTRDFDFSSLFPHSRSEGRHLIDISDHKCSQVTSSPEETDEEVQCWESEETQVCESSQSSCYQYNESSCTEQQFECDDDNQPVIPEREFDSLYLGDEADLLEDGPDVFNSSHCHITEETYTEDLDIGSDYTSQIDDCEIHSDKETDNCDIEGDEKTEPGRVQDTSPPMNVTLENKFSQPRLSIPFVHKAKKDSLTSVKERDKLKALFSVRKKGSLKLTAKAGCLGAGKIQDVENIDKFFESVHPSADENFSDLEQKGTETGFQKSSRRTSESAENANVETKQNLPVVTDMSCPALHAECADPVHKNSEECVLSGGVILARTDHQDLSLQLHSPTQRRKHESPEYFDGAEQKSQADMIIDDDEILREIDSCLATHGSSHDDKMASVNLMESEKFVRLETASDFLAASTVSVETNTATEKCVSYPSYEINGGISKQGDLSSHRKLIGHGNLDEGCSGISVDESNALTAAVSGLTVEDKYESDCPENVASVSSECDGVPQSLFGPSISFSASASSGKALSDQSPSPGSLDIFPAGGSEKTKAAEGEHQIVQVDRAHETEIVSSVSSQSVLTSDSACPYIQLEQDPSGVTDVSIFIDITGDQTTTNENECDGRSSLPAESTTLQPERMDWHTARTEVEKVQCTDISNQSEEEFVTTCFSLVVPRNKLLDISFEPVMKSGLGSDDKNIEIEVMAESEISLENVKLAEVLNMAHLSHAERPESQVGDTGCKQIDNRLDFPEESLPQTVESLELGDTGCKQIDDRLDFLEESLPQTVESLELGDTGCKQIDDRLDFLEESLPQTVESLELGDTGCKQIDDRLDFPEESLPQTVESLELGDTGCKQIDDRLDYPQESLPQTAESPEFEVNEAKPGNGVEKIIQTGSMKEGHENLDEERQTVNSTPVSSVQHDQSAEDVEQEAVGMEVEVTAESTAGTESGGAGTNVTSSSSLEIEPSVSHLEVDSLPTHSPGTSAEMYEVEGGDHYAAEGIDERQFENSVTVTEVDSVPSHSPEISAEMYEVEGGDHYAAEGIDERQLENSVTVTEVDSVPTHSPETSAEMYEVEGGDHYAAEGIDERQLENSVTVTEALNSHDRSKNEDSLNVTEALNSHNRSKNEDTASETCHELQIMPSSSSAGVAGGLEISTGEQYPSSPPCLIHCSEFDHVDSSGSTSSPPVLKPQTTLSTSENLSNSSPPLPSLNLTVAKFERISENTVSQMVHISEKSCRSSADSFSMAAMTDISSLSSVEYCVTSVVAGPVMSLAVVDDGSRDAGCVDVVSDEPPSATHSSSPPDLFPASSATSQAQAARSASHDMDDQGDPCSDDNENKSPVSYDSDDSLGDEPEFLSSVIGSSTPLSTVNPNVPAQAGQGSTGSTMQSHHQLTTFSLDSLLRDTRKAEAEERETLAIQAKLRKELLSGEPYAQEENENDEMDYDDFTDEQKYTLRKLRLEEEEIRDCAPGESILSDLLWGQLFTESVSPAACGVHMGSSHTCLRQLFNDYQPNTLMDILSSDIISLTYHSMPCKSEIQRWLFFIMSVHGSAVEVRKCGDQLHQVLQWQMGDQRQKYTWTPSLIDLFRVFVNWGADLKDPVFDTFAVDQHQLEQKLRLENGQPHQGGPPIQCPRNFEAVLKMLVSWLQARPGYSTQELNQLLLMLCRLSLDHSLCKMYILTELQICLASLLECYQPSEWKSVVPWLCRKLSGLSSHHHNQVYITRLLSSVCPRSCYLQQRLAFLLLYSALTSKQLSDQQIHQFKLADLLALIPEFRHVLQNDNYHVASLVQLLDLSVGPAAHHVSQRKQLFQLLEAVRLIISEIRDSMMRLDCTKVKGMLLHLCLKWDLAVKSNNIKQRKIFSCLASMSQSMPVEQLTDQGPATNEDDNTVDDSAVSFSDSDLNEEDTTVPRVKMLKRDSDFGDVKNHGDGDKHQVLAQDSGGCSVESVPSKDGCGGENSRLSIFETFRLNKVNDLASGDGDVEADEAMGTLRCGEAGNNTAGTLDSPAERGTASETSGLLGSDRPEDVHTDGFMCPDSTRTVSDDDSLPEL